MRLILFVLVFSLLLWYSCKSEPGKERVAQQQADTAIGPFTAAVFSQLAYCNHNKQKLLDSFMPGWKIAWYPLPVNGNHAFVVTNGPTFAVVIRGSLMELSNEALENWLFQDLSIIKQENWPYASNENCRISRGSFRGLNNLLKLKDTVTHEDLEQFLKQHVRKNTKLTFTGHSLGGNLAVALASYMRSVIKSNNQPLGNLNVVTLGATAVGNGAFVKDFDSSFPNAIRVENRLDIVCKFPVADKVRQLSGIFQQDTAWKNNSATNDTGDIPGWENVLSMLGMGLQVAGLTNGWGSAFEHIGEANMLTLNGRVSGKEKITDQIIWLQEALYQHRVAQYALLLHAPVIDCGKEP